MVLAPGLNGLRPVQLFQHHNSGQMVGKGHGTHGQPEIRPFLDLGCHAKGGADEKAGARLAGELHFLQLPGKALAAQLLALRGEDAQPCPLGNFGENQLRFLVQPGGDFGRGGVLRQANLRQLQQGEAAVAPQPLFVILGGGDIEFLLQLSHGDQSDVKHSFSSHSDLYIVYHCRRKKASIQSFLWGKLYLG